VTIINGRVICAPPDVMHNKPILYISHDTESAEYVCKLEQILKDFCGYQQSDILTLKNDETPGLSSATNITKIIKKANKVIAIVSKNYTKYHWSHYEIGKVLMKEGAIRRVTIIPIICVGCTEEDMPKEIDLITPLKANDGRFIHKLQQSLQS